MPDASGKFKGISVPSIPWHEKGHAMSACRPDSSGADWFICPRGTPGCPICHDGMVPYCRNCAAGDCSAPHEPVPVSISVEEFCVLHPEQRELLMGTSHKPATN